MIVGLTRKIRYKIRLFLLRRAMRKHKRRRRVVGYDGARAFALLADGLPDGPPQFLNRLIDQLQTDGKTVDAVVFFHDKVIPDKVKPSPSVIHCQKNDFAWTMRPGPVPLQDLVAREVDILIDLSSSEALQMKYLAALSTALYKVGAHHPEFLDIYDLILNVNEQCKADELAKHAIHYLKMIKTPAEND